jgi:mRNA interferase RelE/StbE
MYSLIYSELAFKQLKKLEKGLQIRIVSTLERCLIRPQAHVKRLADSPYYRLRVGDYRVILDIKEQELIICVIEVGHRKNIYKAI